MFYEFYKCVHGSKLHHWCQKSHKLNNVFILRFNCKKCTNMQQPEKYDKLICPKGEKMSSSLFFRSICIVSIVRWLCNGFLLPYLWKSWWKKNPTRELRTEKKAMACNNWIYEFIQPDLCNYTKRNGQSFASL